MKNIAAYALMAGTMMGLLPQAALASYPVQSVMGVDFKMGNGRPGPEIPEILLKFSTGLSNSLNGVLGCLTLRTTDSIAAYVQGTWTMGVNYAENVNLTIQTIGNSNQSIERNEYVIGAQSEAALLLHLATGRVHESHGDKANDTSQDLRNATDSIAAYAIFYWARGLNHSRNRAVNDYFWRAAA
jgi:hypothetical protein